MWGLAEKTAFVAIEMAPWGCREDLFLNMFLMTDNHPFLRNLLEISPLALGFQEDPCWRLGGMYAIENAMAVEN
jgi:hypothetical protein